MSDINELLHKHALEQIKMLYEDQSVSIDKTIENLNSLKDEIDILIDALEADFQGG